MLQRKFGNNMNTPFSSASLSGYLWCTERESDLSLTLNCIFKEQFTWPPKIIHFRKVPHDYVDLAVHAVRFLSDDGFWISLSGRGGTDNVISLTATVTRSDGSLEVSDTFLLPYRGAFNETKSDISIHASISECNKHIDRTGSSS